MSAPSTLIEAFLRLQDRGREGLGFIQEGQAERFLSYSQLLSRAGGVLALLNDHGLHTKDRVILVLNDNELFITAFWACILGGIIPAPLSFSAKTEQQHKLLHIQTIMQANAIIADPGMTTALIDFFTASDIPRALPTLITITPADIEAWEQTAVDPAQIDANDLAYIQFSSGSTGSPKGIRLTHANLLTNVRAIIQGIDLTTADAGLSWMPLTHDMGLIGFHITPLVYGVNHYLMPATSFVRRPLLWLEAATRHSATILSSPNFGFKHFLDRFEQTPPERITFDLHRIRLIFNGAEPISAALSRRFIKALQPYGLRQEVMFPVYGLAEAGLAVTFPVAGEGMRTLWIDRRHTAVGDPVTIESSAQQTSVELVALGKPVNGCNVRIVDEAGKELPDKTAGRVVIKGGNVSDGYYKDASTTIAPHSTDGWLDTGDIGFFHAGELYITGRTKDLIFVRGQNYYAHDIERVAQEIPGITLGKTAAVGLLNEVTHEHEVVLFVVIKASQAPHFEQLKEEVIKHINLVLGVRLTNVVMIDNIPRTTSGKIQRFKLEEFYKSYRI